MNNEKINLDYLIEQFNLKNKFNENDDLLEKIILFFKNQIDLFKLPFNEFKKINKEDILSTMILFFIIQKKINWFSFLNLNIIDINYDLNNLFQIQIKINLERNLYFCFKLSDSKDIIYLTKDEMRKFASKKNNIVIFNICNNENKIEIETYNIVDIYNLYVIKGKDWKNKNPNYLDVNKNLYLSKDKYFEYKKNK